MSIGIQEILLLMLLAIVFFLLRWAYRWG